MVAPQPLETPGQRVVVVSPHLDDGVLSLGASIASLEPRRSDRRAPHRPRLRSGLGSAGRGAGTGAAASRRRASRLARGARRTVEHAPRIGATPVWLPFGSVDYERHGDEDDVRSAVAAAVDGADLVLVPGFPLTHPDHDWLVRTLVASDARLVAGSRSTPSSPTRAAPARAGGAALGLGRPGRRGGVRAGPVAAARPAREMARDPAVPLAAPAARDAPEPAARPAPLRPRSRVGRPSPGLTSTAA